MFACKLAVALTVAGVMASTHSDSRGYAMRLNLHKGQVIKYKLLVEKDNPKESGTYFSSYTITAANNKEIDMDCRATGLTINGKDRTKDLNAVWGGQVAKLPWTIYSRRTGMATGYNMSDPKPDIVPYLYEAGIYLACFKTQDAKPGDSWPGSTTATGGCTGATFNFKQVKTIKGKQFAYFDVTNIMLINPRDSQVGPMKMIVDLSSGLPTMVDYKVKNSKNGRTRHFRETLMS
jgi:hypothetical protein